MPKHLALLAALLFASGAFTAFAQTAPAATAVQPVYAILSLIGDQLDIVIARQQIGSRLDQNIHEPLAIADPIFDTTALQTTAESIRKVNPRAELAVLNTRSAVLFEKQRILFEERNGVMTVPEAIQKAVKQQGATHLVLIIKHRDEVKVRFAGGETDGAGQLEGLGFYLDGATEVKNAKTGDAARGIIAPFAYIKVVLIDATDYRILKKRNIAASMTLSSAQTQSQDNFATPWNALTSAQKVAAVQRLIQRELQAAVPTLMQVQ